VQLGRFDNDAVPDLMFAFVGTAVGVRWSRHDGVLPLTWTTASVTAAWDVPAAALGVDLDLDGRVRG
jgi:hypothetical protein